LRTLVDLLISPQMEAENNLYVEYTQFEKRKARVSFIRKARYEVLALRIKARCGALAFSSKSKASVAKFLFSQKESTFRFLADPKPS